MPKFSSDSNKIRLQINVGIDVYKKLPMDKWKKRIVTDPITNLAHEEIVDEATKEIKQLAVEFKGKNFYGSQVKAHHAKKSLEQLLSAILNEMELAGLINHSRG